MAGGTTIRKKGEMKLSKQLSSAEHDGKRPEMQGTRTLSEWAAQEAAEI